MIKIIDDSTPMMIHPAVQEGLRNNAPIVALESTVITHGLPYPENIQLARDMETEIRSYGSIPATIGVLDGVLTIGLNSEQIEKLVSQNHLHKLSARDIGTALALGWSGGTTVAGTLIAANLVGIRVFATGGIGGVHRGSDMDISADLVQLSKTPILVVCAGAKSILDLASTLEYLETHSVPVIGYKTDEFPAFFSRSSGLPTSGTADSLEQAAQIARAHWSIGNRSAVLLCVPITEEHALPEEWIETVIKQALADAEEKSIHGQAVSPFLLQRVNELSGERSLSANLSLLKQNARIAGEIAPLLI